MIKKLLFGSMLTVCSVLSGMAQNAAYDLYTGKKNELNFSFHSCPTCPNQSATQYASSIDSTDGPNASCGDSNQYVFDYKSPVNKYWAGNGAWNINDYGFGQRQDYSNHTHVKISYRWVGTDPQTDAHSLSNTLTFTFTDSSGVTYVKQMDPANPSSVAARTVTKTSLSVPVALASNGSAGCVTKYIALSTFLDNDVYDTISSAANYKNAIYPHLIDLSNLHSITWAIGGINWSSDGTLAGKASGTFFVDDLQVVDYTAPTITSMSAASGQEGDLITLTGTNFLNVNSVNFNGVNAPTFTVVNSTTIEVTVPTGATDGIITVSNPINSGTSSSSFDVTVAGVSAKYTSLKVSIEPNPSSGIFNINSQENINEIIVTDYLGSVISNSNNTQVDLSNQPNGLYFLTIISGDKKTVEKLVKQ